MAKDAVGGALYGMFGFSEGLRRHGQMKIELQKMQMQREQFNQQLALQRYSAETGAMEQAKSLAMEWKKFNAVRSAEQVRIDLDREKLDEQKRQFEKMLPIEEKKAEYGAQRVDAYGRGVDARAAYDRAKVAAVKTGAVTPTGIFNKYMDEFKNAYNKFVENANMTFAQLRTNPKLRQQAIESAKEVARVAVGEALMAYNDFAEFGMVPPMAMGDVEAKLNDQGKLDPDEFEESQSESKTSMQEILKDETFPTRMQNGKLNPNEEATMETLSKTNPAWQRRWEAYVQKKQEVNAETLGGLVDTPGPATKPTPRKTVPVVPLTSGSYQ